MPSSSQLTFMSVMPRQELEVGYPFLIPPLAKHRTPVFFGFSFSGIYFNHLVMAFQLLTKISEAESGQLSISGCLQCTDDNLV